MGKLKKRNVDDIHRKNLEDNQLFLKELLMSDIRKDFMSSARSMVHKYKKTKDPIEQEKIEYTTRYKEKVKSGEIPPHIPEWQREKEKKLIERELRKNRPKRIRPVKISRWTLFDKTNPRPYERSFKPRQTKTYERVKEELTEIVK